jgi:predicted small secreted protein
MNKLEVYNINKSLKQENVKESLRRMFETRHPVGSYIRTKGFSGKIREIDVVCDDEGICKIKLGLDEAPELNHMKVTKK